MASLYNPTLSIDLLTGSDPKVTATVGVDYTDFENNVVNFLGLNVKLSAKLVGEDGTFFNGGDDDLFFYPTQFNIKEGTYTFEAFVSRGTLDEDNGNDEIFANFTLQTTESAFTINTSINSAVISGNF